MPQLIPKGIPKLPKAWLFDLAAIDGDIPAQWLEQLSDAEQQRANRFKHGARRNSYIASHTLAYWALQQVCGDEIKNFVIASEGAPLLVGTNTQQPAPAHLSLSHSGNYILCAISNADSLIGCDIEIHHTRINAVAIAKQFFTDEEYRQLQQLADSNQINELEKNFYRMWTCKEAWLKAQGLGIANGLKKISIRANQFTLLDNSEAKWKLYNAQYENHSLAVAINPPQHIAESNFLLDRLDWNTTVADFSVIKTESPLDFKLLLQKN